jgi:hydroxymethylbilane synthase
VVPLRGNVGTRLLKLAEGEIDATVLGAAGLQRIGRDDAVRRILPPEEMLPAVGQGTVGIEIRADDERARAWLAPLDHAPTAACITAERTLLAELAGSCRTPIAGLAELAADGRLRLRALVAMPDGSALHRATQEGAAVDAARIGTEAGRALKATAGEAFFAALA